MCLVHGNKPELLDSRVLLMAIPLPIRVLDKSNGNPVPSAIDPTVSLQRMLEDKTEESEESQYPLPNCSAEAGVN